MTSWRTEASSEGSSAGLVNPAAWDSVRGTDNPTGLLRARGTVLGTSDFNDSYEGWANHFHYATASTVLSRTEMYPYSGSHCLLISPSELPANQATEYAGAGAYKRLGFPKKLGVQSLSAQIAIRGGRGAGLLTDRKYPFKDVSLSMDSMLPDASNRFFGAVYLKDVGDGICAWFVKGGHTNTSPNFQYKADVRIPGSEMWFTGLNEWKGNYAYVRLTVDLAAAAAGTGYYVELQVGSRTFDLRRLTGVPYDLLLNNGSLDMFTAGNNFGFGISRSETNPTFNQVQLLVDNVLMTTDDLAMVG